ncbi:hypothetical protein MPTK1_1g04980 [Marchantia polymorpha subsp. ruderalis]|uniref:Uncharacterized protein n=1 Tax=Marchantia polymorpha subsp. ruderalis TaxID=1480154 RepID=A0AAF6ALM0_MARPO|nr:hypothetical protein Mp_1g04980 [Marchantia polymorpha subsp. ruderalis]
MRNLELLKANRFPMYVDNESDEGCSKQQNMMQSKVSTAERLSTPNMQVPRVAEELKVPLIRSLLTKALKAQHVERFKLAGTIFREVLQVLPKQRICLRALGAMALEINHYPEAVNWLQEGVREYPNDALFHTRLGDAYSGLGKYEEALEKYDRALGLVVDNQSLIAISDLDKMTLADETISNVEKNHTDVKSTFKRDQIKEPDIDDLNAGDLQGAVTLDGLKIACAKVLSKMGNGSLANAILMEVLKDSPGNIDALYEYGGLLLSHGLIKDAVSVFLKLMIARPGSKKIRRSLSKALKRQQGLESLKNELAPEAMAAPALAFIASCVKEYGAISEAVELYEMASTMSPSTPGYFLSLIHLYEVTYEYHKGLEKAVTSFRNAKSSIRNLSYRSAIQCIDNNKGISQDQESNPSESHVGVEYPRWCILPSRDVEAEQERHVLVNNNQENDGSDRGTSSRAASAKPLHQTLVRNEAAYFTCLHQILEDYPIPLPLGPIEKSNALFLAGDSHCLSAAWRRVCPRGKDCVLIPKLVTGLKIWHLRPESDFYPKIAFENTMKSIPDVSKVVMLYGEIDCRDGIIGAVEKGKYQDIEEGVQATVDLYIDILQKLVTERRFELFVHPIPPVLNETRPLVQTFNRILEQRLLFYKKAHPAIGGRLHWLDFVADLLTVEGLPVPFPLFC